MMMIEELYSLLDLVCDKYGEDSDEYVGLADEIGHSVLNLRAAKRSAEELLTTP
jgi:hypothetical protein